MRVCTLFPSTLGLLVLASNAAAMPQIDLERRAQVFVEAFNRQDVVALCDAVSEDFRWLEATGEMIELQVSGREALRDWCLQRKGPAAQRATLSDAECDGRFVSAKETLYWADGLTEQRNCVFEFNAEGLIRRAWRFPVAQPQLDRAA